MARPLSEVDRDRARRKIRTTARRLFAERGLARTTLADVTEPAGIARSTFYRFYDSKETLYLDLLAEDGPQAERRIYAASFDAADAGAVGPEVTLIRFIRAALAEVEHNPLARRILEHPEELRLVAERVGPDRGAAKDTVLAPLADRLGALQEAGGLLGAEPIVVARALRALTLLALHRDDIGVEAFADVFDLLTRAVARGLVAGAEP